LLGPDAPDIFPRVTVRPSQAYLAVLQYDGAEFVGWQRQRAGAGRSVQGEIEAALERIFGRRVVVTGAGRTDTGVHALGQAASFVAPASWKSGADGLRRALNALLPRDVWVERTHAMCAGFHARRDASARRYRYVIGTDEASYSPFRRAHEWPLARPLDLAALSDAATAVLGEHDFSGLAAAGAATPHYRCRVALAEWAPRTDGMGVTFTIEADRFLHRMVRFLVGVMVDIGLHRRPLADLTRLLAASENKEASPPAPPEGLYLVTVRYPPHLFAEPAT
jgi:tRNA pseudouridine38-40 synthase